jgi:hypothetical protein
LSRTKAKRIVSLASVEAGVDRADVAQRYLEPITALQDDDLELPNHIELSYYAIYNLYRSAVEGPRSTTGGSSTRPCRPRRIRRGGARCSPMRCRRRSSDVTEPVFGREEPRDED